MFSATSAALRRSRSKSTMQISGGASPSQSKVVSVSLTRYSETCERSLISGVDSENDCSTVQVSVSRQMPTTESGWPAEKLSRGSLLSASFMDIGFISHLAAGFQSCFLCRSRAGLCRIAVFPKISPEASAGELQLHWFAPDPQSVESPSPLIRCCCD